ncbi:peptidylprolyl isomerase [Cerasicoccus fimbriatus]|uniref:peptidylprolyl isomerase n=1 Tax=Cerasicoccus fimbriatus TaxID=3014554 RepID=UPI0022B587F1|nr:peptidylprolyl isomerase [Cerasicoccus sp. TK19100]
MTKYLLIIFSFIIALNAQAQPKEDWDIKYTNGIAAQVNDEIITLEALRKEVAPLVPEVRRSSRSRMEFDRNIQSITREILQNMIDQILIIDEFNEKGYMIPQSYLDNEYDDYITKEFNGSRPEFLDYLRMQGKTDLQFREELRDRIIVGYMRGQMMKSQTEVSPQKIKEYYEKNKSQFFEDEGVKLRMITLMPMTGESEDLMQQQAATIIEQLAQGGDFAELARKYSQDMNAANGGDWGWREFGDLRDELANAAMQLDVGQYSQPVVIENVTYIVMVEEKRESGVKQLEAVRQEIEQAITTQLARQAQQRWLERLRKKAYIKFFLREAGPAPENDSGPVEMKIGKKEEEPMPWETFDANPKEPIPVQEVNQPEGMDTHRNKR